jgi:hypothetical protein
MIYNTYGEPFYVHGASVKLLTEFTIMVFPWWMTLLFTIAGISSAYALKKRSGKEYAKERISKLLIPLLSGLLLIIPVQSYIADVFHNGYQGGYLKHYEVFFTKFTDLTGYDGGFTPGHTWFILFLFIVSMLALPIMLWYVKQKKKINVSKITLPKLLPLFVIISLMNPILNFSGKSIGEALACFMIGFFLLSNDEVQDELKKYRLPLGLFWVLLMIIRVILYMTDYKNEIVWNVEYVLLTWIGILAILGLGKRYLNFENKFTRYFSPAAFPLYYFHQSVLVIVAFFTLKLTDIIPLQLTVILSLSFGVTLLCYEIFRRFRVTCFLFGIKKLIKK